MAVVDQDGGTCQLTAYYPSGVPYDLTAARATDRLHIAGRWLDHQGMNTYDNTARMYRPKGRFLVCKKSMLQMVLSKVVTHKKHVDFLH